MTRNNAVIAALTILIAASTAAFFWPQTKNRKPAPGPIHYSTLMGKGFFDQAYAQAPPSAQTASAIAGGTVNHHLLAAPLDAQFFEGLAAQEPKRVILIGPDHMSRGRAPITVSAGTWRTPYGDLATDMETVDKLADGKLVKIEEAPFDYEFSVGGLVPFVKRSLPEAEIVTVIVRADAKESALDALASALPDDADTVVVASIDFSHYLPSRAAEFHDITNRSIISSFDYASLGKLEIDSPATLRVLLKYLEKRGAQEATLVASCDSAKITKQLDAPETTSYLNQYFSLGKPMPLSAETSFYVPPGEKIVSTEDRFMRGFMKTAEASDLPQYLRLPDLAVGMAAYADKVTYYLFPLAEDKGARRLMTAAEERTYLKKYNLISDIIAENN